jgi:hypothetical protein
VKVAWQIWLADIVLAIREHLGLKPFAFQTEEEALHFLREASNLQIQHQIPPDSCTQWVDLKEI